ncbi:MAG TPA: hypothetical protein DDW38_05185 [Psychrobacter sp.]|nr:hypothetical protein [Psychrobacter sp.]
MGYFDDLQKAKDAEYIQVQDYIKQLALETNSSIEATINYLINSEINKIYFKDDNSNYMEPYHNFDYDHPLRSCLADLKLDFMQKLVKAQRYSNEVDEIKIFNEIPRINNYFKKTELPTLQPKFNKFSKAPKPPNHIVGGLANLGSLVTIQERETSKIPNNYQSILMRYDYFTPHQACCLIAGLHPNFNGCDDELEMAQDLINSGIKSKKLALDDDGQIKAEDLKKYLSEKSWLLLGFNDYVTSKNSTSLGTFLKKIDNEKLKTELEKAKERISELEQQISKQVIMPADDVQLNGIAKYNANKAYVIATGQALASYLWSMDTTKAIRTGDMVQQVRHVIHSVAPDLLPDDKAIRGWLSDIAPDYAKKGGKTPKDATSEISLTMKK